MSGELGLKTWNCFSDSLEQLVPSHQTPLDLVLISALLPWARSSGRCNNPSVIRFVSLRAGGRAELPLIPVCQKALEEINTVVLVEVLGSRDEMQAAVSMEMPWLQQWAGAGQHRPFQGFSSAGGAVGGRDSSKVCSGVPDSWDFAVLYPCNVSSNPGVGVFTCK